MNILIYTQKSNYLGFSVGGAETSLRMLAEKLAGEGHTVVYLTEMKWGRFYKQESEVTNRVKVHFVGFPDLPSKGIGFLLKFRKKVVEYFFYKIAEKLIRKYNIELVHTYHEVPAMYRFLKLRERKNLNYITVLRNGGKFWVEKLRKNRAMKDQYRYVFNHVDSVNFNTPGMMDLFEEACTEMQLNVQLRHFFVQDIGLDFDLINSRWEFAEKDTLTMVMASRFSTHQKRQKLLVEAVALLPDKIPFRLILVGEGPEKETVENLVLERGVEDRVKITSYMEQQDLWKLIAGSDLYVHACDFEGLSKMIIEAMAMGVPVLASDVAPLNDYLEDGENGFLVKNDPGLWAEKIKKIYSERGGLPAISKAAKTTIESHYLADVNVKKYEQYFAELLNETTKNTKGTK
ncbi:MAG: glycosyltransferase [Balneolaceae bacterium]